MLVIITIRRLVIYWDQYQSINRDLYVFFINRTHFRSFWCFMIFLINFHCTTDNLKSDVMLSVILLLIFSMYFFMILLQM